MFGFGLDDAGAPGVTAPVLRAATQALIARMATPPGPARAVLIDQVIGALIDGGVWAKLDVLTVLAAHHQQAALLNWKGTSYTASLIGAPVFVTDRGIFTDGSDDVIDWGWAPANGVNYQQNSAMLGAWCRREDRNPSSPVGMQTATACTLNPRNTSDAVAGRINSSTVSTGPAATTGAGFVAMDRSASNAVSFYRDGAPVGTLSTAASATRSSVAMGSGRAGGTFGENQFCAHVAGASLTAAEHNVLGTALSAYMDGLGVARLIPTTRTLTMASATTLPDGSRPVAAGRGMAATGLARDLVDGTWWIGTGLATALPTTGLTRVSADLTTVIAEYTVAGWGLGSAYDGSVQGVSFDSSGNTLWAILKITASGAHLLHIARDGTLIGAPIALSSASANGVAVDVERGLLAILLDSSPASIRWFDKTGMSLSATTQVIGVPSSFGDQVTIDPATGDLYATWGDNGASGIVGRYRRSSYGGHALVETMTLAGADSIEGVVLHAGALWIVNDAATHPGTPPSNRILSYTL